MKQIHLWTLVTALAALCPARADIIFGEYHGTTTDPSTAVFTQLGNATSGDTILGYDTMLGAGLNPQEGIFTANTTSGNTRYFRFRSDLRGGQNEYQAQAGSGLMPASGTIWNATEWSNVASGNGAYLRYSAENWPDDGNTSDIGTPQNGFTTGLNWALVASTDGGGIGSAVDSTGSAHVYAIGVVWNDVDLDGNIDTGDNLYLRYVVGADTFAEIDTTAELNAAIPEPGSLSLLALAGALLLGLRRLQT